MAAVPQNILDVHTPTFSFVTVYSLTEGSLQLLYDNLSHKVYDAYSAPVAPGWLKYEFNGTIWTLDDDQDYTIFAWRCQQRPLLPPESSGSSSCRHPTLHLHNPAESLPAASEYRNASYYLFLPSHACVPYIQLQTGATSSTRSGKSPYSLNLGKLKASSDENAGSVFKRNFEKFHAHNGVRTVFGSIGPVKNVRMLLKAGYSHVYISRKFALRHGLIPKDSSPGHYGYGGLVNIGTWPITLIPTSPGRNGMKPNGKHTPDLVVPKPIMLDVYLSEEPHFDVVLGRSFIEKRKIQTTSTDPTDVTCLDTGEKVECEFVVLKDGNGEIVTVT